MIHPLPGSLGAGAYLAGAQLPLWVRVRVRYIMEDSSPVSWVWFGSILFDTI